MLLLSFCSYRIGIRKGKSEGKDQILTENLIRSTQTPQHPVIHDLEDMVAVIEEQDRKFVEFQRQVKEFPPETG